MKKIGEYKNGNYITKIYDDGTRIRQTECNQFIPSFPESIDLNISSLCSNNCYFCYADNSRDGLYADLTQDYLYTMKPYTEIAINLNSDFSEQPYFFEFLERQKERNVIVNGTINIEDFKTNYDKLKSLQENGLLHGIGISLGSTAIDSEDLLFLNSLPNTVFHVVNKVVDLLTLLNLLKNPSLKILVLGYKAQGRGRDINPIVYAGVPLGQYVKEMLDTFDIVSFDNLALEQLKPQDYISKEQYDLCYQGDDGAFSFYIDAVKNTFAVSSSTDVTYPIDTKKDILDAFLDLQP